MYSVCKSDCTVEQFVQLTVVLPTKLKGWNGFMPMKNDGSQTYEVPSTVPERKVSIGTGNNRA